MVNTSFFVAEHIANIWILHDKRAFRELNKQAKELAIFLKYNLKRSKALATYITEAYRLHAEIDEVITKEGFNKKQIPKIKQYERKIANTMATIFKIAKTEKFESVAKHHAEWWMNFLLLNYTKNKIRYYPLILWHLFAEQWNKLGKLFPALNATYRLYLAGRYGHNRRDKKRMVKEFTKFWEIILKYDKQPLMF